MSKLFKKIIALILVLILISANMIILGEYTIALALSDEELNEQTSETNHRNVKFDSYFYGGIHKQDFDIKSEDAKIYLDIDVNNSGYLENGTIEFLNANFKLKEGISNENIQSIDVENNKIVLNRLNSGSNTTIELPIELLKNEEVSLDYFNKETTTKFTGRYVDGNGDEKSIEKEVANKLSWSGTAETQLKVEATKYVPYATNGNYGVLVQAKINSNVKDATLPIKQTNIEITVPTLNGIEPTSTNVVATNTEATNGNQNGLEFTNSNYSYDQENGKVIINTQNLSDKISWKSKVSDEYLVTFIFEGKEIYDYASENGIDSSITANSNITLYNNEENVVNNAVSTDMKFTEREGTITDFAILAPNNISKGYLYANYDTEDKVETEYYTKYNATIYSSKLTTSIEFIQSDDEFLTEEENKFPTTIGNDNYAYNKRVEISQEIFNKILGEDGEIIVKSSAGTELGKINKDSTLEDGVYVLDISSQDNNELVITTSAPITEGQIEINIVKALKGDVGYSKEQIKTFEKMQVNLEGKTNTTTFTAWKQILLKEPETKLQLSLNKTDLTTVLPNKNVEIRAVLDTSSEYNALFENPTLEITLPSYIEEIELNSADILLGNGLKIKDSEVTERNGKKVITVELEGNQTEYSIDAEYKGAIISLDTDLTTDVLTPSGTDKITMNYSNENDVATKANGTIETEIDFVAPNGVVAASGISNYKDNADEILTISDEPETVEIETYSESRIVTVNGSIINNYNSDLSNVSVLGRIPSQGNKKIDTDTELGSTFDIPLSTGIGISGVNADNYTIYYSDNIEATRNLEDSNNGWTEEAKTTSKSFLIVFNDDYVMNAGDTIEFSYDIEIPENLTPNNSSYGMYKVYYDNNSEIGTMSESKNSAVIGFTTGTGPELNVQLSSTSDIIKEGQVVKMRVTIENTGTTTAENVKVNVPLPEYTRFVEFMIGSTFTYISGSSQTLDVGTIEAGETRQVIYYLRVDEDVNEDIVLEQDYVFPRESTSAVTVTCDGVNGEITSNECTLEIQDGNITIDLIASVDETHVLQNGQTINYLINLTNISRKGNLTNVIVTLPLPDGIKYVSATVKNKWSDEEGTTEGVSFNEENNTLEVNIGTLEITKLIELELQVINADENMSLIATAKADNIDNDYSNNSEHIAENIELEISELTSTPRYVKEGENITYNLTLTNNSNSLVTIVRVVGTLPSELEFQEATFTYAGEELSITNLTDGKIEIPINQIQVGESIDIEITVVAGLLSDMNDKEVSMKFNVSARNFEGVDTNTVTNIIEYNSEMHPDDPSNPTNNRFRITGTAWLDENMDGRRDTEEQTLSDIQVVLLNQNGNALIRDPDTNEEKITTTSENGTYQFDNLPNGDYLVVFIYDSSNYSLTTYQKEGIDESLNSDAIDINLTFNGERRIAGITDVLTINGNNVRDIDIGLYSAEKFDLRLDKYVNKITLTTPTIGTSVYEHNNAKVAKVEVLGSNLGRSSAVIEYKIVVTNEGSVPGYVNKIVDYLPEKVNFSTDLNTDWYLSDNGNIYNASLENEVINPGESKEVDLIVSIQITEDMIDTLGNSAEIYEYYNEQGLEDIDSTAANEVTTEDDMSSADVVVSIVTGKIVMYTSITLVVIALLGFGIFAIKKHVLNKKV